MISSDLVSPALKSRKHYLSFNPKQDFFLDLDDVLEWFESVPEVFNRVRFSLLLLMMNCEFTRLIIT